MAGMTATQIRLLRRRLALTQTALADKLGVSQSAVAHWEEGRRKPGGSSVLLLRAMHDKKSLKHFANSH